ncbi:MAG: DNA polymerase III subunit alpha [Alphaproteobacteria bacterium]|nr:DNA polymerase III subunit alpha [Alphaproteobacteria bacterium]
MPHADFIHLRVHSAYSLAEGAIKIKDLIARTRAERAPAVAITDHGNLFGTLEFALAAGDAGIQPIIGCELPLVAPRTRGAGRPPGAPEPIVVLAQSERGYRNLMALASDAFLLAGNGEPPALSLDQLAGRSEGLLALSGGTTGPLGRRLLEGNTQAAGELLDRLRALFPGRLYIELQRHGMPEQAEIEPALLDLAYARGLPLVATNDAYFTDASMAEAQDVLLCIGQGTVASASDRRRLTPEHRLKSAAEMRVLFADLPEAIDNTLVIARRCGFAPGSRAPILPPFASAGGKSEAEHLRDEAAAGLERRMALHVFRPGMDEAQRHAAAEPYRARLAFEQEVIVSMGFAGYFLIVADFIRWAKTQGIPVGPGRGSGAASVVAWSLGITELDPLRWGLLFERFLNPERVSMPDFDIDFCQERRDEVIHYVQRRYGKDRVAQIITFGKLQARAVLRDVGRVLAMPYGQVDRITKLVPNNPANPVTLAKAIEGEPRLQTMRDEEPEVARLFEISLKLEGLYRNASTHAAGVVIGDRPLTELVPLYRDPRGLMPATQFSMKYVEQAGLVKFDFLGLKTLDVLDRTVALLKRHGIALDLERLPLDDAGSFSLMQRGETTGVFQLESTGMRDVLRRLKPDRFEDVIAIVALYRPGPMDNIPSFIKRKHSEEPIEYLHPLLEPVLKETYGIPIYQEQVMEMARVLAGYSLGGADLLRRAMGKKVRAEMAIQREAFLAGAKAKGVDAATTERIFEQMEKFAGYGFNKPHAAAYALIAYQTAYCKANYPVEFFAASMTLDQGLTDKLAQFRQELGRIGIPMLPPDINRSEADFAVETDKGKKPAIRYALAAIKGVGRAAMQALVGERERGGAYRDLFDLADRLDARQINKRQMEALTAAGAFDAILSDRGRVHAAIDQLLGRAHAAENDRNSGQTALFSGAARPALVLPAAPAWPQSERLQRELDAIGFYLSAHPLDAYGRRLERLGVCSAADLLATTRRLGGTGTVTVAGVVLSKSERMSRSGSPMAFVQLSDATGVFEVTLFSEVLALSRSLLEPGRFVLARLTCRLDEEQLRLQAQSLSDLDSAAAATSPGLKVWLALGAALPALRELMQGKARQARATGKVSLVVEAEGDEIEVALPGGYAITPSVSAAIADLPGVARVLEL